MSTKLPIKEIDQKSLKIQLFGFLIYLHWGVVLLKETNWKYLVSHVLWVPYFQISGR